MNHTNMLAGWVMDIVQIFVFNTLYQPCTIFVRRNYFEFWRNNNRYMCLHTMLTVYSNSETSWKNIFSGYLANTIELIINIQTINFVLSLAFLNLGSNPIFGKHSHQKFKYKQNLIKTYLSWTFLWILPVFVKITEIFL